MSSDCRYLRLATFASLRGRREKCSAISWNKKEKRVQPIVIETLISLPEMIGRAHRPRIKLH